MVRSRDVCYGLELVPSPRDSSRLAFRASPGLTDQLLPALLSTCVMQHTTVHYLYRPRQAA